MHKIKDIEGFENLYAITDNGKVWSYKSKKYLSACIDGSGYLFVALRKNKKTYFKKIHRLVAEAFIQNPYKLPEVNHKNEDKTDNRVENIEWSSVKHNRSYGTRGERISESKKKPVVQKTLYGATVFVWNSALEAKLIGGFNNVSISKCANGKKKTHKGYKWEFI